MQINTLWTKELAKEWGVSRGTAKRLIRDDPCTNVNVAAWIFRRNLNEAGSLRKAIAWYNSRTPSIGSKYRDKVIAEMKKHKLLPSSQKNKAVQKFAYVEKSK
jgi:soluble lytic murein transglycosylase-like protein